MATIISKNGTDFFISYAPGTGSSSLEQYIRTVPHYFEAEGCVLEHIPKEEFGIGSDISRHLTYTQYLKIGGRKCHAVATGIRNPFSYYYAEYKRMLSKWSLLLGDKESWIYRDASKDTLDLTLKAKELNNFDQWFRFVLLKTESAGYIVINGDHLEGATHYIQTEDQYSSFVEILLDVHGLDIRKWGVPYPHVNQTGYHGSYREETSEETKLLALKLFYSYNSKFGYGF